MEGMPKNFERRGDRVVVCPGLSESCVSFLLQLGFGVSGPVGQAVLQRVELVLESDGASARVVSVLPVTFQKQETVTCGIAVSHNS